MKAYGTKVYSTIAKAAQSRAGWSPPRASCRFLSANAFQNDVLDFTAAHPFDYLKNLPLIV
jgi:hypothetical protein